MQDRDLLDLLDLSFASEEGLDAYLARVLDRCAAWFNAAGASVFLQDSDGGYTVVARSGSEKRATSDAKIVPGVGIAGTCIETKQPLLVNDPAEHPLLAEKVSYKRKESYTAMVVPLVMPSGDTIGVLNVSRSLKDQPFSDKDLRLAKTLGNNVALAISNARLVDSLNESLGKSLELQHKLYSVIQHAGVSILLVDRAGTISECNGHARDLADGWTGDDFAAFLASLPRGLRQVASDAYEEACLGDDCQERAFDHSSKQSWLVTASPMPDGGVTMVVNDVTEHEQTLQELGRVRRLAEIGQMTAAIAHEIRNPLASISSAAQFVQSDKDSAREFGAIIESEAMKLNSLCDEFLSFARPFELDPRPLRLNELVLGVASAHKTEFERADIELKTEADPSDPIVFADYLRLEQACRNLILNALQACAPGGSVTVSVSGSGFSVRDTGAGMDSAVVENLYTPFFTTKAKGTGLGLSNVKKIVDAHRGRIDLDTAPKKGTTFSIRLEQRSA